MSKKTQKKLKAQEIDINMIILSNDPQDEGAVQLFQMFYNGVFGNSIGVMQAKNKDTGKIEALLVGVEGGEEGPKVYPLARILDPSEVTMYLSPDGKGGYFGE